jgi:hypothetical protein
MFSPGFSDSGVAFHQPGPLRLIDPLTPTVLAKRKELSQGPDDRPGYHQKDRRLRRGHAVEPGSLGPGCIEKIVKACCRNENLGRIIAKGGIHS